jgi:hypothetical protein
MAPVTSSSDTWWVRQQHDDFKIIHQQDRPSAGIVQGERAVKVWGPFRTQSDAQSHMDREYRGTIKGFYEGANR